MIVSTIVRCSIHIKCCFKNVTCIQQALREMSRDKSDVELEKNADACDMTESDIEPTDDSIREQEIYACSTPEQKKVHACNKCDQLANKITRLQKKISWLKKSKQKLNDSLNMV